MNDEATVLELMKKYGERILPVYSLPKAYCPGGTANVKGIYLGCDPSNSHSESLPFVFAHESGLKVFSSFLKAHTEQLKQIGLGWEEVYTQNLCRNYFKNETSKNPIWAQVANEFWIKILKEELSQFDYKIPVLLTSAYLYHVLVTGKKHKPIEYYQNTQPIPIPSELNKLNRPLIPLYRNRRKIDYHLSNPAWESYRNKIKTLY
ncbi:MAG: hypothetical protein Q8O72_07290 [Bacteroidales bacterium]|nr:hypothetical protein [Bacteroidales bacterium]